MLKAGVLDGLEVLGNEDLKPKAEQFIERRPPWMRQTEGATQVEGFCKREFGTS
jgi:hypothetical protein